MPCAPYQGRLKEEQNVKKLLSLSMVLCLLLAFSIPAMAQGGKYDVTEPITIEFWHALANDALLNELIDEFEVANPLITVNPICQGNWEDINTKLSAAIAGGDAFLPAVITLNPSYVATFTEGGMVEKLDDYVAADGYAVEEFSKGMIETFTYLDELVGLPYLNSCLVMYYNKDIAAAEGIELPTDWSEMQAFVDKAATPERKAIAFHAGGAWYYECFFTNRLEAFGPQGQPVCLLDDPKCIEVATALQTWFQEGKCDYLYGSSASADGRDLFSSGQSFAYFQSVATYQTLSKMSNFEVGMVFPFGGERGRFSHVGGQGIALTARASQAQKNAGWQLVKYLTSEYVNLALAELTGYLPTRTTTISSDIGKEYLEKYPAFVPIIEMLDYIEPQPTYNNSVTCNGIWRAEMSEAIIEGGDMEKAMLSITKQIREIIEED